MRREIASPVIDLEDEVAQVLDARLRRDSARPVALALSGGGDSVALLLMAQDWAKQVGRSLLVLTVDHGLSPESPAWTEACRARAERLGLAFRALRWAGEKPATGLPAAARAARHRRLAEAAREAGAYVILMGHTADDVLEARAMRTAGGSTPEPREWSPSPAWPEGRGVFLLRPLLGVRRAALRRWLTARGETWIEDPANSDPRFARARVRLGARAAGAEDRPAPPSSDLRPLATAIRSDPAGGFELARAALRTAGPGVQAFVSIACLCAGGGDRPPASARVRALAARLQGPGAFTATLAGARVTAAAGTVRFDREAGERARGGLQPLRLQAGETGVWDGRFEVTAPRSGMVGALAGVGASLPKAERETVRALPAPARPGLPAIQDGEGVRLAAARALTLERLRAACGMVEREP